MSRRSIQILAALVVGLLLLLFVTQQTGDRRPPTRAALLPEFRGVANDVTEVRIDGGAENGSVTLRDNNGTWSVTQRDGYPANVAQLRQLIIALANAEIVEEKTSDPEQYDKLGLSDPDDGVQVELKAPDSSFVVILGDSTQRDRRYARVADDATSYLIDDDPEVPATPAGWLDPDVVDIAASNVKKVVVSHADGETITVDKSAQQQTDFDVSGIPEGRDLSYATIGNGVAGALAGLTLEDVRKQAGTTADTTTVYETWDGLVLTVAITQEEDSAWVSFEAASATEDSGAADRTAAINERVAGWQYQLADFKKNLLTRRWDDLLKTPEAD